jgi:hypothetical protein
MDNSKTLCERYFNSKDLVWGKIRPKQSGYYWVRASPTQDGAIIFFHKDGYADHCDEQDLLALSSDSVEWAGPIPYPIEAYKVSAKEPEKDEDDFYAWMRINDFPKWSIVDEV